MMMILRMLGGPLLFTLLFVGHMWMVFRQDVRRENGRRFRQLHRELREAGVGYWPALWQAYKALLNEKE